MSQTETTSTAVERKPAAQTAKAALTVPSRLPYTELAFDAFGIGRGEWKALVEAIFPNAQSPESVILALSYCRARKLDPFKRNVHIVPIWNRDLNRMIDTIWPGIGELRTTAFRTGQYAGRDPTTFGETVTKTVGKVEVAFPEWASVTVYRMVEGERRAFAGDRVYWLETYATRKRDDDSPNEMWLNRPVGQITKCAEAAALRAAFPEEVGSEYIPEEVQHAPKRVDSTVIERGRVPMPRALGEPAPAQIESGDPPAETTSTESSMTDDTKADPPADAPDAADPSTFAEPEIIQFIIGLAPPDRVTPADAAKAATKLIKATLGTPWNSKKFTIAKKKELVAKWRAPDGIDWDYLLGNNEPE